MTTLLALDPSLTAFGWAVLVLDNSTPRLMAAGVIETKPAPKKTRGLQAEDDARRVRFIRRELAVVIDRYFPAVVAVEAGFGSQSAKAAVAKALAQAAAACVVDEKLGDARAIYITPIAAGVAVGLSPLERRTKGAPAKSSTEKNQATKARKAAIARAVIERLGAGRWARALGDLCEQLPPIDAPRWEGAHDAAAIGIAAWDHPIVSAIRAMVAQQSNAAGGISAAQGDM